MNTEHLPESTKKRGWRIPYSEKILHIIQSFSLTEKVVFTFFAGILFITSFMLLWQVNKSFLVDVPDHGGSLTEGILGSPRFVNPLLAVSDADRDLTSLVYSGLIKIKSDGTIEPDLAKSWTVSDDELVYTFTLKDRIYFHDGTPVTADDVIFTITKAQDPLLQSPRRTNWNGVKVEKIDDRTVQFTLKQPYSPFIQNMTLGILPKHIWKSADNESFPFSQFNLKPIGSGPYKVDGITYTSSGLPSEYHLTSFGAYALGEPYISRITIKSYQNDSSLIDAYKSGNIESLHSISPKQLPDLQVKNDDIIVSPLPRVFGVFFNQNVAPALVYKEVRQALDIATDKKEIIDTVLGGYGQAIQEPVPPITLAKDGDTPIDEATRIQQAQALLTTNGWKQNASGVWQKKDKKNTISLTFSLSTSDAPELKVAAQLLQKQWEKIGVHVDVKIFEIGDLNQNIIRPRKYDALLFGEVVGRDMDLYPFWHSSQRNDPGLNIAMYTNLKADKLLENIRQTGDLEKQQGFYADFNKEIRNDMPAVFTYSPYFIYIIPKKVHDVTLGTLTTPSERFSDVQEWYIETNSVWKIFIGNK